MTRDDTPPLPAAYGDTRVPQSYWAKILHDPDLGCWIWNGAYSPSGNPVHRRTSVWRFLFRSLCPNTVVSPGTRVPPRCEDRQCVNPDHRIPPAERPPVFACPACGQNTDVLISMEGAHRPLPEKRHTVWPDARRDRERRNAEVEADTKVVERPKIKLPPFKIEDNPLVTRVNAAVDPPPEENPLPLGPATYKRSKYPEGQPQLTGRIYRGHQDGRDRIELTTGKWVLDERLTDAQRDHGYWLDPDLSGAVPNRWVEVTRKEWLGKA